MKSPFPGMDPYLERHWPDVHAGLVAYAAEQLNERLPPGMIATKEERVAVEAEEDVLRRLAPDISVRGTVRTRVEQGGTALLDAPYRLVLNLEPLVEHYIKILDSTGEQLITVIEFLSPTNKLPPGLSKYKQKRRELLLADVTVVEIDLVRTGDWVELLTPHVPARPAITPYRVTIHSLYPSSGESYLYPIRLSDPLPRVTVPLRPTDVPVKLDLQPLIERVYATGRYPQRLNYSQPADPPLEGADAAWAEELLRAAGKR